MNYQIKPLDFSGVFEKAFKLTLSNIKSYSKLYMIFFGVILAVLGLIFGAFYWYIVNNEGFFSKIKEMPYIMRDPSSFKILLIIIPIIIALYVILLIMGSIFTYMSYDLFIKGFLNEPWDMRMSFNIAKTKIGRIFGAIFGVSFVVLGGVLLCCVGLIPAYVFTALILPVLVYENLGISASFKRAYELTKPNFWEVFVLIFVYLFIMSFLGGFIQFFSFFFGLIIPQLSNGSPNSTALLLLVVLSIVFTIVILLIGLISNAFSNAFYTILYFNQRVKVENFGQEQENIIEDQTDSE
ncbi:MAG TPA: hypothetical protein PK771_09295 [Spirochaetota bacterium]|nr:hypothetical protein [Spirochaetota bacterium]